MAHHLRISPIYLLVLVTTTTIFGLPTPRQRELHRLVGGHLKVTPADEASDEADVVETSASGSKEKVRKVSAKGGNAGVDEERKTLSQQVAEGKYGLIQKELFTRPAKRPGILSYADNNEVPEDNRHTLGGLDANEIWLAEDHLLVLKGGLYPKHDGKESAAAQLWPAIDNFEAPLHQVKIPKNPAVPPPFPVRLGEGGPLIQIVGANASRTADGEAPGSVPPLADGWWPPRPPDKTHQAPPTGADKANVTAGHPAVSVPGSAPGERGGGVPFPPAGPAQAAPPPGTVLNGTLPPYFGSLPPGATFLPPPDGQQSPFDEDDPSIYYPPPYTFYYKTDNSSKVPPGPLVPGIVLPPPPEFFAPLEEDNTITTTTMKTTKKSRQRKPTTTYVTKQIYPTSSPSLPSTIKPKKKPIKPPTSRYPVKAREFKTTSTTSTTTTTQLPTIITVVPLKSVSPNRTYLPPRPTTKKPMVAIVRPVTTSTAVPKVYVYGNEVSGKLGAFETPKTSISTTQLPLKYFTTGNEIESNSVTQVPEKFSIGIQVKSTTKKPPAQYYFYEEDPDIGTNQNDVSNSNNGASFGHNEASSAYNTGSSTYRPSSPRPYFIENFIAPPRPPVPVRKPQKQYIYVTSRPYNTQKPRFRLVPQKTDTFSVHIAKLQKQISQYLPTKRPAPKPVYQYSFEATNFRPSPQLDDSEDSFRPMPKYSVQIQQAIEIIPSTERPYTQNQSPKYQGLEYYSTPRPVYRQYAEVDKERYAATPKPITQYSYQATPNPIFQGFYTKPDDYHFDENTKHYFTMFGRKLPNPTTPLSIEDSTPRSSSVSPKYMHTYDNYTKQRPISLHSDTVVNYANPQPQINPDAELITPVNYPHGQRTSQIRYVRPQRPTADGRPEIIKAVPIEVPHNGEQSAYISYQLPGDDGAHFYFLTPQLANSRRQGASYYHQQTNRVRRGQ